MILVRTHCREVTSLRSGENGKKSHYSETGHTSFLGVLHLSVYSNMAELASLNTETVSTMEIEYERALPSDKKEIAGGWNVWI